MKMIGGDPLKAAVCTRKLDNAMTDVHELIDAIAVGIYSVDSSGTITYVNAGAERLLGHQRCDLIGHHHHDVLGHAASNGSRYDLENCPICLSVTTNRRGQSPISRLCHADGTMLPIIYEVAPWVTATNSKGSAITFRDATEQQNLLLQLLRAQKLESIGQLAAGIAHELNTPIQYVGDNCRFMDRGFKQLTDLLDAAHVIVENESPTTAMLDELRRAAQLAEWSFFRQEIPSALSQSLDGINRVASIVKAMKEFSHSSPNKVAVDLSHVIQNTVTIARNEWKYVANVVTKFDPSLPNVYCLSGEISQVILNLLVNAAHAIDSARTDPQTKGTITIATAKVDGYAEIRISDTGTGIPPDVRKKVFEPFFTTKPVGKGTGQGLALAYRIIVERHKGTIDFETEVGRGTTFIIRLSLDDSLATEKCENSCEEAHSVC